MNKFCQTKEIIGGWELVWDFAQGRDGGPLGRADMICRCREIGANELVRAGIWKPMAEGIRLSRMYLGKE